MTCQIRAYKASDYERALQICVAAFKPIHAGFAETLGDRIFDLQYNAWQEEYAQTLSAIDPEDALTRVYVAETGSEIAGFVFTIMDEVKKTGEIGLNAVDPVHQGRGIGKAMYRFALDDLKRRGAEIAYVGTAGDDAHAPARAAYNAVGFDKVLPSLHYFRTL